MVTANYPCYAESTFIVEYFTAKAQITQSISNKKTMPVEKPCGLEQYDTRITESLSRNRITDINLLWY
jgi:hypothetical protein